MKKRTLSNSATIINVFSILSGAITQPLRGIIVDPEVEKEPYKFEEVRCNYRISKGYNGVLVELQVNAKLLIECSNCCNESIIGLSNAITENYVSQKIYRSNRYSSDLSIEYTIDSSNKIDILPAICESLVVIVPLNPVCKSDCKGLCLVCYADKNVIKCLCDCRDVSRNRSKEREPKSSATIT